MEILRWSVDDEAAEPAIAYRERLEAAREALRTGASGRAGAHLCRAVALDPTRPEAFNLLGVLDELTGDRVRAQKHWRVALALDSAYEPARRNLERSTHRPSLGPLSLG